MAPYNDRGDLGITKQLLNLRIYGYLYLKTKIGVTDLCLSHNLLILKINTTCLFVLKYLERLH